MAKTSSSTAATDAETAIHQPINRTKRRRRLAIVLLIWLVYRDQYGCVFEGHSVRGYGHPRVPCSPGQRNTFLGALRDVERKPLHEEVRPMEPKTQDFGQAQLAPNAVHRQEGVFVVDIIR